MEFKTKPVENSNLTNSHGGPSSKVWKAVNVFKLTDGKWELVFVAKTPGAAKRYIKKEKGE